MTNQATDAKPASVVLNSDLARLLRRANVPTLPIVAQKLVDLCKDDTADFHQFARVIETDSGLAGRIMRVANSAYYGLRHKATTLERAITVLGLKYVKSISLGFHLASALSQFRCDGFDMGDFWRQSVLRGVLARQIAADYCSERCEEAFLVGLLQDCGVPFLVEAFGAKYARMWRETQGSPASLFSLEREVFEFDHTAAAEVIAERWSLPDLLSQPMGSHHRRSQSLPSMAEHVQLCQIAYFVGSLPLNNPGYFSEEDATLSAFGQTAFRFGKYGLSKVLRRSNEEFSSISQLFAEILPENVNVARLLGEADNLLSSLASEMDYEMFDLVGEVEHFRDICEQLDAATNENEMEGKQIDSLTGLLTSGCLQKYLAEACDSVEKAQSTLALLVIDIDNFNDILQGHGRRAGDLLLRAFGELLGNLFGENGCVARYGGARFAVALRGLRPNQAVYLAEVLGRKVREVIVPSEMGDEPGSLDFSSSIGLVFCESGSHPGGPERVLELAGDQTCQAKKADQGGMSYHIISLQEKTRQRSV